MRPWLLFPLLALCACGDKDDSAAPDDGFDPAGDADGDGFTNGAEVDAGSDPDDASDVPYEGGWVKDAACRHDVQPTGNGVGQVAEDFALQDQFGETLKLHDFCDHVILIEFSGFT
jgi:hypothetical protein